MSARPPLAALVTALLATAGCLGGGSQCPDTSARTLRSEEHGFVLRYPADYRAVRLGPSHYALAAPGRRLEEGRVQVYVRDNPDGLDLDAWFDARFAGGMAVPITSRERLVLAGRQALRLTSSLDLEHVVVYVDLGDRVLDLELLGEDLSAPYSQALIADLLGSLEVGS